MSNETVERGSESRVDWEHLEEWVRGKVQEFVQGVLEEEVTEFLGRRRWERRSLVDNRLGYRNGYGKARKLTLRSGTIEVRRPRVCSADERFESRVLPLVARRNPSSQEPKLAAPARPSARGIPCPAPP